MVNLTTINQCVSKLDKYKNVKLRKLHNPPSESPDVEFVMLHSAGFEEQLLFKEDACVAGKT
jgi:hypothetical protein